MICKNCGKEVDDQQRVCPNCGLILNADTSFAIPERDRTLPEFTRENIKEPEKAEEDAETPEQDGAAGTAEYPEISEEEVELTEEEADAIEKRLLDTIARIEAEREKQKAAAEKGTSPDAGAAEAFGAMEVQYGSPEENTEPAGEAVPVEEQEAGETERQESGGEETETEVSEENAPGENEASLTAETVLPWKEEERETLPSVPASVGTDETEEGDTAEEETESGEREEVPAPEEAVILETEEEAAKKKLAEELKAMFASDEDEDEDEPEEADESAVIPEEEAISGTAGSDSGRGNEEEAPTGEETEDKEPENGDPEDEEPEDEEPESEKPEDEEPESEETEDKEPAGGEPEAGTGEALSDSGDGSENKIISLAAAARERERESAEKVLDPFRNEERKKHQKTAPTAVTVLVLLAVAGGIYYWNPQLQEGRVLRKANGLMEQKAYPEAVKLLQENSERFKGDKGILLLLSDAYIGAGMHENAVATLESLLEQYPEDSELKEKLLRLTPRVAISVASGTYTDPVLLEVLASPSDVEINYDQKKGEDPEQQGLRYSAPISLSTSGNYMISAYGIASDGRAGEKTTVNITVDLDPEKYHLNDFETVDGVTYYINADGSRATGWQKIREKYYYFAEDGSMQTGLQTIDRNSYYLNPESGEMQTGWVSIGDKRYFFSQEGSLLTNVWIDKLYYVGEDGAMLTNTTAPDGSRVGADGKKEGSGSAAVSGEGAVSLSSVFQQYPNALLHLKSKSRKASGNNLILTGKLYHENKSGRPSGKGEDITVTVSRDAWLHYLDKNIISIQMKDAVKFLPDLYMQKVKTDKNGVIIEFHMLLGDLR